MNREQAEKLFYDNKSLAYHVAWKFIPNWPGYKDEILNDALLGLWKGAKAFDPSRGVKFSTYGGMLAEIEILRLLRSIRKQERGVATSFEREIAREGDDALTLTDWMGYEANFDGHVELNQAVAFLGKKSYLLRSVQGYSQMEIASATGYSQAYVSRKIKREREAVREALGA